MTAQFELEGPLPQGRLVVEASAGTGKTYSLSALVARHVAERKLSASSLLVVTFTRAAAAELRDRTRRVLVQASEAMSTGLIPDDQPWMRVLSHPDDNEHRERVKALAAAVASFDDATITTIHGFCQQALRQLGFRAGTPLEGELGDSSAEIIDEVCRDVLVATLASNPNALDVGSGFGAGQLLGQMVDAVTAVIGNPGAVVTPSLSPDAPKPAKQDTADRLALWVNLVHQAVAAVRQRRAARGELGYDDLVVSLRDAVRHPDTGPAVVKALNDRYHLVLVDEFQDTDPVQWQIFDTAFTQNLVTVGDPKQAIYRFRGADVHAYLRATEGAPKVHLTRNFRSDSDLVRATNVLIDSVELGDPRIVGTAVQAAEGATERAMDGAPLQIRCLQFDESLLTPKARAKYAADSTDSQPDLSLPLARAAIIDDLVERVVEMLELDSITVAGQSQKVSPGHIAVLVPSGSVANQVMTALGHAGVPSVRTRTGSVFETPAALEWRLLLSALERPSHAPTVRAAGLGAFMRSAATELDPAAPDAARRVAVLQQRCAQWADDLANQPFLAWYDHVRSQSDLAVTLLSGAGGERSLTDFDHIAEMLSAELGAGRGTSPSTVLRVLDRLEADGAGAEGDDPQMRRIDSDAEAVQITTVHSSKGLEYPIVLLPIPFHVPPNRGARVYNDANGDRVVDIAKHRNWHGGSAMTSPNGRKYFDEVGARGDRLRLLYVGLTRGEHRTMLWWAPVEDAKRSSINTVLFDRDEQGTPLNTRPDPRVGPGGGVNADLALVENPGDAEVLDRLAPLVDLSEGCIEAQMFAAGTAAARWVPLIDVEALPQLAVADPDGRVVRDAAWKRWSFSSITADRPDDWMHQAPVAGGADEPVETPDEAQAASADTSAPAPAGPAMPLRGVKGGTSFGTMVHTVLERIDPTRATLEADVREAVLHELRSDRLDVDVADVVAGLCAAIRTPLGAVLGDLRLADIPVTDRLAELDFDLPLHSDPQRRITPRHIGAALLASLPADDPQLPYAQALADGRYHFDLAGFLQGSIDAVFRVPGADGQPRFVVVDYKTNRLHDWNQSDPLEAYHPDLLPAAMAHSDYPLQALLYSVAVHRYLRWRLPGYSPEVHLGGIGYLFVRGMVGADTPQHDGRPYGVFQWQPPAGAVLAIDRLFADGAPGSDAT